MIVNFCHIESHCTQKKVVEFCQMSSGSIECSLAIYIGHNTRKNPTNCLMNENLLNKPSVSFSSTLPQVGSYSYDMARMVFNVSTLGYIQRNQSIVMDYDIIINNLREEDKVFDAGPLGNYSLAGFEMVR